MADMIIIAVIGIIVFMIVRNFVKKLKNKELGCGCSSCDGCAGNCQSFKEVNTKK